MILFLTKKKLYYHSQDQLFDRTMKKKLKTITMWGSVFLAIFFGYNMLTPSEAPHRNLFFSEFVESTQKGIVKKVNIKGQHIIGETYDNELFSTHIPYQDLSLVDRLLAHNVKIEVAKPEERSWLTIFLNLLPTLLSCVFLFFLFQQQGGGMLRILSGKRKKYDDESDAGLTFDDIAGMEEVKESLLEIVDFLKNPKKFVLSGAKIPKGVLLSGSPGTGKTLLAKAVAGEAGVPFFFVSGSEFIELFAGIGSSRVRDLFETARKNKPCIVFIDEIDSIASKRGARYGGGKDEQEQTLNQLLVELDGFEARDGVILIASTNRLDVLDPALTRPGRCDRKINVPLPNFLQRVDIIAIYTMNLLLDDDVDLMKMAQKTIEFSGAHIANMVNEAVILAVKDVENEKNDEARIGRQQNENNNNVVYTKAAIIIEEEKRPLIRMKHFIQAIDHILLGSELKSVTLRLEDKTLTAYHEASHAVMAFLLRDISHPISKVTIVPRETSLGLVLRLPEYDVVSLPKNRIITDIRVALAGRLGEELFLNEAEITTGASEDIKYATSLAHNMVTRWGMSPLGMMHYVEDQNMYGMSVSMFSESTKEKIDIEVRKIIHENYEYARHALVQNWHLVKILALELLKLETLDGSDVYNLLNNELEKTTEKCLEK